MSFTNAAIDRCDLIKPSADTLVGHLYLGHRSLGELHCVSELNGPGGSCYNYWVMRDGIVVRVDGNCDDMPALLSLVKLVIGEGESKCFTS